MAEIDARLREVRAVYTSAGGYRFQIVLHDIGVDYSLTGLHLERIRGSLCSLS